MAPATLWIIYDNNKDKVTILTSDDISDLKRLIKTELQLSAAPINITLSRPYESILGPLIDSGETIVELLSEEGFVNDRDHPLVVDLKPLAPQQGIIMLMLENDIGKQASKLPLKRTRSAASITSRGSDLNQQSFRNRIVSRDVIGCVLTGKDELDCEACHIIPWTYFQKNDLVGKKIFDTLFPYSCDEPEHRVMDVRNGILMWHRLNAPFDKFDFTIVKKSDVYVVETLGEYEFPEARTVANKKLQLQIIALDGKMVFFNPDKRNEWPGEKFLKFHNECFYAKKEEIIKAQAGAQQLNEDDSAQTIAELTESISRVKNWYPVSDENALNNYHTDQDK
jgi:hypothetical protein